MPQHSSISVLDRAEAGTAKTRTSHEGCENRGRSPLHALLPSHRSDRSHIPSSSSSILSVSSASSSPPSPASASPKSRSHTLSYVTYYSPTSETHHREFEIRNGDEYTPDESAHQLRNRTLGSANHCPRQSTPARSCAEGEPGLKHLSANFDTYSSNATAGSSICAPSSLLY